MYNKVYYYYIAFIIAQVKVCSSNNDESLLAIGCESGLIVSSCYN